MTVPATAPIFTQIMDPTDILDFYVQISQGQEVGSLLLDGEEVASFSLTLTAEGTAAGVRLLSDTDRLPIMENRVLRFWVDVEDASQGSSLFASTGILIGIVLTFTTTASPSRKKQRTLGIRLANQ